MFSDVILTDPKYQHLRSIEHCEFFGGSLSLERSLVFGGIERTALRTVQEEDNALSSNDSTNVDSDTKLVNCSMEPGRRPNLIEVEREKNGWVRR